MLITKSVVGCATCSLLTENPHPVNASTISGTDIDGNQNWPVIVAALVSSAHVRNAGEVLGAENVGALARQGAAGIRPRKGT